MIEPHNQPEIEVAAHRHRDHRHPGVPAHARQGAVRRHREQALDAPPGQALHQVTHLAGAAVVMASCFDV